MSDPIKDISDARTMAEAMPRWKERFEATKEIRNASDELWSSGRYAGDLNSIRIASIPEALLGRLLEIDPLFLIDKVRFKKWLEANPEYKTTNKRV